MPDAVRENPVLGIIGGGQLALYVCEAAQSLGIEVSILADSADEPALRRADMAFTNGVIDSAQLDAFLDSCDVVTFDKESIPDDILAALSEHSKHRSLAIRPALATLRLLKDKGLQKTWLREQGLPTLPFQLIAGRPRSLTRLTATLGHALVQKRRRGGYDGRGVQLLPVVESPRQFWNVPSVVESLLPDCQEISVLTVRALSGAVQTFPPVSMNFDAQLNAVRTVAMPAAISPTVLAAATALAERTVNLLQGVGVFAIEMFVTRESELFINEISPRVHNSGHLTQDACNVSQFEQHVRAVMDLPLVGIMQESPAVMCNILYTPAMAQSCPAQPVTERRPDIGATVYWYGKATGTMGRKMGHINAVAPVVADAMAVAERVLAEIAGSSRERVA